MSVTYKKILVVNTFGIGDVLFSTPMLMVLKRHMPLARIRVMCNRRGQYILQSNKNIDGTIIFEKDEFRELFRKSKLGFIKKIIKFSQEIKREKYDLAIDLSLGYQISLLLKLLGIKRRIGFNYRERGRFLTDRLNINGFFDKHVVIYYLDTLKLIGINNVGIEELEYTSPVEAERWADAFKCKNELENRLLIGIAPGGGKSWGRYAVYRRWDPANFAYVAEELYKKRKDAVFIIFGSKEERKLGDIIQEKLDKNVINLCGKLPLQRSIALIKRCNLLLCNDGGILHIAVSQGVKTVSIFGPVDDRVYGPYPATDMHKVIKADNVECRPCYQNFKHKMCNTHHCLVRIDKDTVFKLVEESLNGEDPILPHGEYAQPRRIPQA